MRNWVPCPGAVSTAMCPPYSWTMPCTVASPMPLPLPTSLVEKNGSNMRSSTSGRMPDPVSRTATSTMSCSCTCLRQEAQVHSQRVHHPHPDPERARALHGVAGVDAQVHQHLLELHRVEQDRGRVACSSVSISTVAGSVERSSLTASRINGGSDNGRGSPRWPRLKVSICWIRSRARVEARRACSRYLPSLAIFQARPGAPPPARCSP